MTAKIKDVKLSELTTQAKLEQAQKADTELAREIPRMVAAAELYDPDYKVKPLEFDGLYTGIPTLDEGLLGVGQRELVFLGAPTNIGKTTIALYVALNFAIQGKKVVYMLAEDNTEWATDLLNTIVKSNEGLDGGLQNLFFITDEESIKFVGHSKELVPLVNSLSVEAGVDWFFLDMLNNLADPLEDRNFSDLMSKLRQNCNRHGHSIWCNCRFREPRQDSEARLKQETYSPDMTQFYGKSTNYMFSVTKALALTPCEVSGPPDTRSVCIKILKNKRAKIGTIGMRHRVLIGDDLKIKQPTDPVLTGDIRATEDLAELQAC